MVERALSMREVRGSMPRISNFIEFQFLFLLHGSIRKVIIHDYTKLFSTSFFTAIKLLVFFRICLDDMPKFCRESLDMSLGNIFKLYVLLPLKIYPLAILRRKILKKKRQN